MLPPRSAKESKKQGRQKGIKRKKVVIYSFPTIVIVVGDW